MTELTRTRTVAVLVALLATGAVVTQVAAVPGLTAQQADAEATEGVTVDSLTAPSSAAPGSNVTVVAAVSNNGDERTTEPVEFRVDGAVVDRALVTLDAGENTTVRFTADTTGLDPGEYRHAVFTESDGSIATITLSESFTVADLEAPANATAGDNVTVSANVTNPNDFNATRNVTFRLEGTPVASQPLTIAANETTNVTFNVSTTDVEPGTYVHGVFSRDDGQFAVINLSELSETDPGTEEPPADNETEEPPVDNETEEPPVDNETEEPPVDNETEEPPVDNETEEPPADNGTEEPTDSETEEPPADNETEEPPADNETEEPTDNETEGPVDEPTETEGSTAAPA